MTLFYISFATDEGSRGGTVVDASSDVDALVKATTLGINPGGEAAIIEVQLDLSPIDMANMLSYENRLVTPEELLGDGGKTLGDLFDEADGVVDGMHKCCAAFAHARGMGTDNEGFGRLITPDRAVGEPETSATAIFIGSDLPPINYCPWCAAPVSKEAIDKQASDDLDAKADAEARDRD